MSINQIQSETTCVTTPLTPIKVSQNKPSDLNNPKAYGVAEYAKKLGAGMAAAAIIKPLEVGAAYVARLGGYIPELTRRDFLQNIVALSEGIKPENLDIERLSKASCYIAEYIRQFNLQPFSLKFNSLGFRALNFTSLVLIRPVAFEILYRGLLQDVLFNRAFRFVVRKIAPEKEEAMLDSLAAKAARIALTTLFFSFGSLEGDEKLLSDPYVALTVVRGLVLGVGTGILKESKVGFLGSIGAHMASNFIFYSSQYLGC